VETQLPQLRRGIWTDGSYHRTGTYSGGGAHEFRICGFAIVVAPQLVGVIRAGRQCISEMNNSRSYTEAPDIDLVEWSGAGDRRAFDQIVVRHGTFALRVAARIVSNSMIAEELVQEAMVRAWTQSKHFDPRRARFSTWLYRIVVNLCIDHGRRVQPEPIPDDFDPVDPQLNADEMLESHERSAAIALAVRRIAPPALPPARVVFRPAPPPPAVIYVPAPAYAPPPFYPPPSP